MQNNRILQRVYELEELARQENLVLPLPAATIARLEETGAVIDLCSGEILIGLADQCFTWEWTPAGEALLEALLDDGAL